MKNFSDNNECPVRNILSRFGDKWSILVLTTLASNGKLRFNEIHRAIGDISHRMLTVTLCTLEEDGLIVREVFAEVPPKVEYDLTEFGWGLMPHINALVDWAVVNQENVRNSRKNRINLI